MKCNVNTNEEGNYHFPLDFTIHLWQSIDNCPFGMDFISISFQDELDFLLDVSIIIMEKKNCTIVCKVFVCKTKYFVRIIIYVTIPKGDNCGSCGDKRNWQVGKNFNNEENKLPTSKILQSRRKIINTIQKYINILKCTYKIPQTNTFKSISFNSLY
jgi:hypothetical protein